MNNFKFDKRGALKSENGNEIKQSRTETLASRRAKTRRVILAWKNGEVPQRDSDVGRQRGPKGFKNQEVIGRKKPMSPGCVYAARKPGIESTDKDSSECKNDQNKARKECKHWRNERSVLLKSKIMNPRVRGQAQATSKREHTRTKKTL